MGRKRKSKKSSKAFTSVIFGMILIILGLVGSFCYGPVGQFLTSVSAFLFGEIYLVPLILLIILGIYILYNRILHWISFTLGCFFRYWLNIRLFLRRYVCWWILYNLKFR